MKEFQEIGIIGAGGWGTALAILLAEANLPIRLWGHNPELVEELKRTRLNSAYLPVLQLPENIFPTHDLADLLPCGLILFVTPSRALREVATQLAALQTPAQTIYVSCTKGMEHTSGKLMTDILQEVLQTQSVAVLSGPNHALEVAEKIPAAAVIGCRNESQREVLQKFFSLFPTFRTYSSDDLAGIQLGGALKNIFAIGAGCSDGFRMGDNAKAALVTRSLAEMMRLGVALGGKRETFYGLSGIGDLMVTCFSRHSRNRSFGERLGQGESPEKILQSMKMVTEGVPTTRSAFEKARELQIETPVIDGIHAVLYEKKNPQEIMKGLLGRSLKAEAT